MKLDYAPRALAALEFAPERIRKGSTSKLGCLQSTLGTRHCKPKSITMGRAGGRRGSMTTGDSTPPLLTRPTWSRMSSNIRN